MTYLWTPLHNWSYLGHLTFEWIPLQLLHGVLSYFNLFGSFFSCPRFSCRWLWLGFPRWYFDQNLWNDFEVTCNKKMSSFTKLYSWCRSSSSKYHINVSISEPTFPGKIVLIVVICIEYIKTFIKYMYLKMHMKLIFLKPKSWFLQKYQIKETLYQ